MCQDFVHIVAGMVGIVYSWLLCHTISLHFPTPPKRGGQQHRKSGLRMGLTQVGRFMGLCKMIFRRFFSWFPYEIYEVQKDHKVFAEG